jgi:hypothetical protein
MRLSSSNRTKVYDGFIEVFEIATSAKFKWQPSEKDRVKNIFIRVAEAMNCREEEDFDKVFNMYQKYLVNAVDKWIRWDKRDRLNYVGFMDKKENISIFVSGVLAQRKMKESSHEIAGTKHAEQWDF